VLVLRAKKQIPLALLQSIEREGLGERRVEGFGRVLFLRHEEEAMSFPVRREENGIGRRVTGEANQAADRPAADQLAFVERRIVLSAARRELDRVAADIVADASRPPTTSLLGRIRTLFRTVRDEQTARRALGHLGTWCENGDGGGDGLKPEARKKLQACRTGRRTLMAWLRALAEPEGPGDAWRRLVEAAGSPSTLSGLAQRHHLTTDNAAEEILDSHAAELTVHLIDGVLAGMARRNRGAQR
jgi:hypothetical protein